MASLRDEGMLLASFKQATANSHVPLEEGNMETLVWQLRLYTVQLAPVSDFDSEHVLLLLQIYQLPAFVTT